MNCPRCNTVNPDGARFCKRCGADLDAAAAAAAAAVAAQSTPRQQGNGDMGTGVGTVGGATAGSVGSSGRGAGGIGGSGKGVSKPKRKRKWPKRVLIVFGVLVIAAVAAVLVIFARAAIDAENTANQETYVDYADGVVEADESQVISIREDGCEAVLSSLPDGLGVGNVVLLSATEAFPFGLAMKVTEIKQADDGTFVLEGTEPELYEIYDEFVINEEFSYAQTGSSSETQGEDTQSSTDLKTTNSDATLTPAVYSLNQGSQKAVGNTWRDYSSDGPIEVSVSVDFNEDSSMTGSVTLENIYGSMILSYNKNRRPQVDAIDFKCDIVPRVDISVSYIPEDLREVKLTNKPIPVYCVASCGLLVDIYAVVDASGSISFSTRLAASVSASKNSTLSRVADEIPAVSKVLLENSSKWNLSGNLEVIDEAEIDLSLEASVGLKVEPAIQLGGWDVVGLGIEGGLKGAGKTTKHENVAGTRSLICLDLNVWAYCEVSVEAFKDSDVVDAKASLEIFGKDNSPVTKELHIENGQSVPECTWTDDDASSSGAVSGGSSSTSTSTCDIELVLDVSGSMNGDPLDDAKSAARRFADEVLDGDMRVGAISFSDDAEAVSALTSDASELKRSISTLETIGGTNMESGLVKAQTALALNKASKRIIVLMSDGAPNGGKVGAELIEYAQSIKDDGVRIYTVGFNESDTQLMYSIASDDGARYYDADEAGELEGFFSDIADEINGTNFIYAKIACPVDVTVTYEGETISSTADSEGRRASFGTVTLMDAIDNDGNSSSNSTSTGDGSDQVKVLRLKEGPSYDIQIDGTGTGTMDYTIAFVDDEGDYTDYRNFNDIDISSDTKIATTAEVADETTLKVDEDGDGSYEKTYVAGANEDAQLVDNSLIVRLVLVGCFVFVMLLVAIVAWVKYRRWARKKMAQAGMGRS